jgi:hypothetical protein
MTLNAKTQNYKFVDPTKSYNFYIENIFIWHHIRNIWFFQDDKCMYVINMMLKLYIFFLEQLNDLKCKNSKLHICRSHLGLQLSYRKYLHLTPYKNDMFFSKTTSACTRLIYCWNFVYFFEHLNDLRWKNSKLESYRYRREL